jgi:hypothetical protein
MHDEGLGLYFWKKSYVGENVHPAWPAIHAGAQHSHTYRHNALHPITGLQGCIDSCQFTWLQPTIMQNNTIAKLDHVQTSSSTHKVF